MSPEILYSEIYDEILVVTFDFDGSAKIEVRPEVKELEHELLDDGVFICRL